MNITNYEEGKIIKLIPIWGKHTYANHKLKKDKILLKEFPENENRYNPHLFLGILEVSRNDIIKRTKGYYHSTDSFQIRPSLLYQNDLGIFYNSKKGRKYLDENEVKQVDRFIKAFKGGIK